MMVFTIGFTQKSAQEFFHALTRAGVKKLIDVRINNRSQLAGFSKAIDLEYFLKELCGITYVHEPMLAPTKELLSDYRNKRCSWAEYEEQFLHLMRERRIEEAVTVGDLDQACLLCSEATAEHCHRRLVIEYLQSYFPDISVSHL